MPHKIFTPPTTTSLREQYEHQDRIFAVGIVASKTLNDRKKTFPSSKSQSFRADCLVFSIATGSPKQSKLPVSDKSRSCDCTRETFSSRKSVRPHNSVLNNLKPGDKQTGVIFSVTISFRFSPHFHISQRLIRERTI
jgi:hypothetical protein